MILDTSFIVDVMRGDAAAVHTLEGLESGSEALIVPTPVVYELWEGVHRSRKPIRELDKIEEALRAHETLPLTDDAARRAGRISAELIRQGTPVDDVDILIAAMAIEASQALVTRNVRDFQRIADLRLVEY